MSILRPGDRWNMNHFLDPFDITSEELHGLLTDAARLKKAWRRDLRAPRLLGRVLGLIFEKPSLRTRVSFQTAMAQLGGTSLFLSSKELGVGSRESVPDCARTISQYVDAIVLRTFSHATVEAFAAHSSCPVINGLSDRHHPCQALADLFTMQETFGELAGRTLVFVGDGNNVARSLAVCCAKLGVRFVLSSPDGYRFDGAFVERVTAEGGTAALRFISDPQEAVRLADIVYTDVWVSMGQEEEGEERLARFTPYQVNAALLAHAPLHARVMHCLPARRGEEITSDVMEGERSIVFQQAGNRLHAQKALLQWLFHGTPDAKRQVRRRTRKAARRPPAR